MLSTLKRRTLALSSLLILPLLTGCDAADIVYASLDLAYAIIAAAA